MLPWRTAPEDRSLLVIAGDRFEDVAGFVRWFEDLLPRAHPESRTDWEARLAGARRGEGPTLFDMLVEVIRDHGPGGSEPEDGVVLELSWQMVRGTVILRFAHGSGALTGPATWGKRSMTGPGEGASPGEVGVSG